MSARATGGSDAGVMEVGTCLVANRLQTARIGLCLPGIIVMFPGTPVYKSIVFIQQGEILGAVLSSHVSFLSDAFPL
jgi:uncharacterized membrane protein YjjB (DUF3815 family)